MIHVSRRALDPAGRAAQYPVTDSGSEHSPGTRSTRHGYFRGAAGGDGSRNRCGNAAAAVQARNALRFMPISEPPGNQPIHRLRGVVELLVRRVAVASLHFRDQPAVVTHLGHRGANRGPVVVAEKQIRVDTLIATAPAMLQHVLQMNACDPRPVDLDPLFGKAGVVDVADVEMNPDG